MRAHRAFRQLAMLLSKAGFSVLRADRAGRRRLRRRKRRRRRLALDARHIATAIDELKTRPE